MAVVHRRYAALAVLALPWLSVPAWADYTENFDELSINAPYASPLNSTNPRGAAPAASLAVPLVSSNGGLTVSYTDTGTGGFLTTSPLPYTDPYGWVVRSNQELDPFAGTPRFNFQNMTGNLFLDFGNDPLKISLSSAQSAIQFNFGLRFPSSAAFGGSANIAPATSLVLTAFLGGVQVATDIFSTAIPAGREFEEGFASFGGVSFDQVDIVSTNYDYALYNGHGPTSAAVSIAIDNVEIPEPGSLGLLGVALIGLAALRRRVRQRL